MESEQAVSPLVPDPPNLSVVPNLPGATKIGGDGVVLVVEDAGLRSKEHARLAWFPLGQAMGDFMGDPVMPSVAVAVVGPGVRVSTRRMAVVPDAVGVLSLASGQGVRLRQMVGCLGGGTSNEKGSESEQSRGDGADHVSCSFLS